MKKLMLILALFVFLGIGQSIASENDASDSYVSFRPCNSWSYDFEVNGYVCRFTGSYIQVPSNSDIEQLQRVVRDLEGKVQDLERRVQYLESSK